MYLRQLTSRGSFVFPQSRSAVGGFRGSLSTSTPPPQFIHHLTPSHYIHPHLLPPSPLLHPCFNPRFPNPILPHPSPLRPARFVYSGQLLGPNYRPFCSSNGLIMERPDREREPPPKRRKSSEERPSSKLENKDDRTNYHYKDRKRDKYPPEKHHSRDRSQEKGAERTKHGRDAEDKNLTSSKQWKKTRSEGSKNEKEKARGAAVERDWTEAETKEVDGSNSKTAVRAERHAAQAQSTVSAKSLHRHWELSPVCCSDEPVPPGVSAGFDFTVMSYNILSQDLLQDNSYLYRHCEPGVLQWEYRLNNILREIQEHNADILCLQEVQEDHFVSQIKPALEAQGYQCEYKKRTGDKSDGCAVIFRRSRLSLLSSNPVEFYRRGDSLLDRDNVGLVVILSPVSDPSLSLVVANTHLLYNPRRGDIKLAQLAILLAELHRLSRPPDGSTNPVLLCGDFNSTPWSPLYSFLTTGHLDFEGMPIGMVSGQESIPRGQRLLSSPLWNSSLGINNSCQYQDKTEDTSRGPTSPTAVEGAISWLTVDDLSPKAVQDMLKRWRIEHGLRLQSSYTHRLSPDGRAEITTCHSRTAMTVDYILYTPDQSPVAKSSSPSPSLPGERGLQLLGKLSLVGRSELEQVNGLPNRNHSSDHLPLLAKFRLQP